MTRTKYMTHFLSAADGYINLEAVARGLANELYEGAKALVTEVGIESALAEFETAMESVEKAKLIEVVAASGDKGMTLNKYCSGWKQRKYEMKKGLTWKIDPNKHETFSKYRKAIDLASGGNTAGSNGGSGKVGSKEDGSGAAPSNLSAVTSKLSAAVSEKLNLIAKHLSKLDDEQALKVLNDCDGAIHRLSKAGMRFANVANKTA